MHSQLPAGGEAGGRNMRPMQVGTSLQKARSPAKPNDGRGSGSIRPLSPVLIGDAGDSYNSATNKTPEGCFGSPPLASPRQWRHWGRSFLRNSGPTFFGALNSDKGDTPKMSRIVVLARKQ